MLSSKVGINETVSGTRINKSRDGRKIIDQNRDRGYQRVRIRKSRSVEVELLRCAGGVNAASRMHRSTGAAHYFFASVGCSEEVIGVVT